MTHDAPSPSTQFASHPYLKADTVEQRSYQTDLATAALAESSIVVLPTGTGKTIVALHVLIERLHEHGGKVLFLAPTKPLVEQQAEFYRSVLSIPDHEICLLTGDTRPDDRADEWDGATSVVVATPQVVQNDLIAGRISLADVCHLTFDECHRATGEYAYNYIAERYWKDATTPLVTGLSASPGTSKDAILTVARNLGATNVEVLTEDDPAVAKHTFETSVDPVRVSLDDETLAARDALQAVFKENLTYLKRVGALNSARKDISIRELNGGMAQARKLDDDVKYKALSVCAEAMRLHKCLETVETQGMGPLRAKLDRMIDDADDSDASKAVQRLVEKEGFKRAYDLAQAYDKTEPKQSLLRGFVIETLVDEGQVLVFTQSRENAVALTAFLNENPHIAAHRFIGQSDDDGHGMTQTDQQAVLEAFRDGTYDVLVSTSIGEEGLDIPQVSLVVFYEPVPSGVRSIQRRGRTGRAADGSVKVLIAEGTRDEGYWYAAKRREDSMHEGLSALAEMTAELNAELGSNQQSLQEYTSLGTSTDADDAEDESESVDEVSDADVDDIVADAAEVETPSIETDASTVTIVADTRETASSIARRLDLADDVTVRLESLAVGDYVLSDRVAVERKSAQDFADTLVGGKRSLFEQMGNLASNYERPVLLLEGTQAELYEARNIHPNAIRAAVESIAIDFGVSVLWARTEEETAQYLVSIARREQMERGGEVAIHGNKQTKTITDQQEYIVASIADVGPVTARSLLEAFTTVQRVMSAEKAQLQQVDGIGDVTAERIYNLLQHEYEPTE